MTVPWEVGFAPRELHQDEMNIFAGPPRQKQERKSTRRGKGKQTTTSVGAESALDLISEGLQHAQVRQDVATNMTDLAEQGSGLGEGQGDVGEALRVHKRQLQSPGGRQDALCSQVVR